MTPSVVSYKPIRLHITHLSEGALPEDLQKFEVADVVAPLPGAGAYTGSSGGRGGFDVFPNGLVKSGFFLHSGHYFLVISNAARSLLLILQVKKKLLIHLQNWINKLTKYNSMHCCIL